MGAGPLASRRTLRRASLRFHQSCFLEYYRRSWGKVLLCVGCCSRREMLVTECETCGKWIIYQWTMHLIRSVKDPDQMLITYWCWSIFNHIHQEALEHTCTFVQLKTDLKQKWSLPQCQAYFTGHVLLLPCNTKWNKLHCQICTTMFLLLAGLASAPCYCFIFPCRPDHISPSLPFKGGGGALQETVVVVWLHETCSYLDINWFNPNQVVHIALSNIVEFQIILWWMFDVAGDVRFTIRGIRVSFNKWI